MKILLVSGNKFDNFGGYEKVLLTVLTELQKKNNNIIIFSAVFHKKLFSQKPIINEFKNFEIYRFFHYNSKNAFRIASVIHKILKKPLNINSKGIIRYLKVTSYLPDIAIVTDPIMIGSVKLSFSTLNIKAKIIFWDHGTLHSYFSFQKTKIFLSNEIKNSIKKADAHLVISSDIENLILKINAFAKIYKIFNPIEKYNDKLINRTNQNIFLYVGRIEDVQKNITFAFKGLSKIRKEWKMIIVGDGPDKQKLQRLSEKLKINNRIEWRGFRKNPYENLLEITALLLTSRWEGFPLVIAEANARGIPVITTNVSGASDIIISGVNGYIIPQGDLDYFVNVLNNIIDHKMTFDTPENISKTTYRFSKEKIINNIINIIEEINHKPE
jgi:UDP-D-galactose:(glucosyl)LPS alpha-1,6-D-galactosyltransferase